MYVKKPLFEIVDIADEHIAVPVGEKAASFQGVVALTDAASFLLNELVTPKSKEELLTLLTREYDVDVSVASNDLDNLISSLLDMDVIEKCEEA